MRRYYRTTISRYIFIIIDCNAQRKIIELISSPMMMRDLIVKWMGKKACSKYEIGKRFGDQDENRARLDDIVLTDSMTKWRSYVDHDGTESRASSTTNVPLPYYTRATFA